MSPCTSLKFKQPVTKPNLLPLSFFLSVCLCSPSYEEWEKSRSPTLSSRYGWLYEVINAGIFGEALWIFLWAHSRWRLLWQRWKAIIKKRARKEGKNESWLKEASILRGFKLSLHLNFARNDKASSPLSHTLRTFCNQCCRYFLSINISSISVIIFFSRAYFTNSYFILF